MKNNRFVVLLMLGATVTTLLLSACSLFESSSASARTPEEAITEAMRDYLDEQGAPISQMEVHVEQIEGDFARVEVISTDPESPGGFNAYLKRENNAWTTIISGSGMEREHVQAAGIPESVWPEGWTVPVIEQETGEEPACPTDTQGNLAFTNSAHGYCLLYPDGYSVEQPNPSETVLVVGSLMNHTDPRVSITAEPAKGRSAAQAADEELAHYSLPAFAVERTETVIGGQDAVILDNLPGQDINRQLFVAHEDMLYHLFFTPFDPSLGETYTRAEELFDVVTGSIVFQTPSSQTPTGENLDSAGDILPAACPSPTEGTLLLTDEEKGYCLLYPASHTVVMLETGNTEIVVGEIMNHIDPRVSITTEDLAGRTLEEVVDEFLAGYEGFEIDRSSLTVAGEPAVLLDRIPGQDAYRAVFAAHNGQLYNLQIFPFDETLVDKFPQAEQIYATVIDSFAFMAP